MRRRRFHSSAFFCTPATVIISRRRGCRDEQSDGAEDRLRHRRAFLPFGELRNAAARVRMRLEVQLAAPPIGYVGVELGRREVGVAEHLLDAPEIGAALEQMRREGVAQEVRVDALRLEPGLRRRAGAGSGRRRRG